MNRHTQHIFSLYYLITPLFLLIELVAGINIRVTLPWGSDFWVYIYLAACFVFGGFLLQKSFLQKYFALFESSFNILLLVMSIYVPLLYWSDVPTETEFSLDKTSIVQFCIVAPMLLFSFYSNPLFKRKRL